MRAFCPRAGRRPAGWLMVTIAAWGLLSGCVPNTPTAWPALKPPFREAVPQTGVFQYDPSSGKAVADKELGQLVCGSRLPMHSGQRQMAAAELMLNDAIYFTAPQTISLSAMVSLEWSLVALQKRDIAWVQAELRLENMSRPEGTRTLVFLRQVLNTRGRLSGEKHLFNVESAVPVEAGRRYRAVFAAKTVVMANGDAVNLTGDEWKTFVPAGADAAPAANAPSPQADDVKRAENRADVVCTLHYFKMR
jgi:hypothetical protein